MLSKPKFVDSLYFVGEDENWHLKPGAPKEVQDEFNKFMEVMEKADERGVGL
jgi:hypothetical protein